MGLTSWAAFQKVNGKTMVMGDLVLLQDQVNSRSAHIDIVAIHQHMIQEKPRIIFLHYWGVGKTADLAKGLKAALDRASNVK